jgi:hypothetical protein
LFKIRLGILFDYCNFCLFSLIIFSSPCHLGNVRFCHHLSSVVC